MIKRLLIVCLTAASAWCHLSAQPAEGAAPTPFDYSSRFIELNRRYATSPDDILTLVQLSDFYSDQRNPVRNLPLAMEYIERAERIYSDLVSANRGYSQIRALLREGLNVTTLRNKKQAIATLAHTEIAANTTLTESDIARYLAAFKSDAELVRTVRRMRVANAYADAAKQNTPDAYYAFYTTYLGTAEADSAEKALLRLAAASIERMESNADLDAYAQRYSQCDAVAALASRQKSHLAFVDARSRHSVEAYRAFLSAHPSSDDYLQALDEMEALLRESYERLSTPQEYIDFIEQNSDDELAEQAMEALCSIIIDQHNVEAARAYLQRFPLDQHYNRIYQLYYSWHAEDGSLNPLQAFAEAEPSYPFQAIVNADLDEARAIDKFDLLRPFKESMKDEYISFIRHHTGKKIAFVALQRMLQPLCAKGDWKGASERMGSVILSFEDVSSHEFEQLRAMLTADEPTHAPRTPYFAPAANVSHAVLHPDGHHLYFTRHGKRDQSIQIVSNITGSWGEPQAITFTNIDNKGTCIFSFFDDGEKMLLGKDGDIMIAQREGDAWRVTDIPPYPVNTDYYDGDASMLPDGTGMLIVSDRPGGLNLQASRSYYHGDTAIASDIYYIPHTINGWGDPVNLGIAINTPYCELSPLLSRNQKTLYFITDGRGGMGYGDVMMVERTNANDWTRWQQPVNLGRIANTAQRELSIAFGTDEKTLLIASNAADQQHIYSVPLHHDATNVQRTIAVDASEAAGKLLQLNVADYGQQGLMREIAFPDASRPITIRLYTGKRYVVYGNASQLFIPTLVVDEHTTGTLTLHALSARDLQQSEALIELPTVVFDDMATQPRSTSTAEIERIAQFLRDNPQLTIDIKVRVDGRDRRACYELSVERALALRRYLSSRGISPQRVAVSGYGNTAIPSASKASVAIRFLKP